MIKRLKRLLLPLTLPLLTVACHDDKDNAPVQEEEPVNLTISLKVPRIALTRGVSDDPRNEEGDWTIAQKLTDGRELYHVTLFLVEETTGKLVGLRDIEYGSEHITDASSEYGANGFSTNGVVDTDAETGTEVTFNFLYDHPRHGNCEKLRRGEFRLLAVANYTAKTEHGYSGLTDGTTKLETLVDGIKNGFDIVNGAGVDNFFTTYQDFFDFQIHAGDGNLCDKNYPQPLSLVQDIFLNPGDNHVNCELKRTYARVRIEVMNNSSSCYLRINGFNMSGNFAQTSTYLFDDPDDPDRKYEFTHASPSPSSGKAMTSCAATTDNPIELPPTTSLTLYDAYILESKDEDNGYTYNLDIAYGTYKDGIFTLKQYNVPPSITETPMTSVEEIESHYTTISDIHNGDAYILQNSRSGKFLTSYNENGTEYIYQGNLTLSQLLENFDNLYMWKFARDGNNKVYMQNVGTENWVNVPQNNTSATPINAQRENTNPFTITAYSGEGYANSFLIGANGTYLNNWANAGTHLGTWSDTYDQNNAFRFYLAIPNKEMDAVYTKDIPLEIIDPVTAHVSPITSIKRNDFINILVTTSLDEMNGDFRFIVIPWEEKEGYIEFN